jgi:hypothetical protein
MRAGFVAFFIIGAIAFAAIGHDAVVGVWTTAFPGDPTMRTALQLCANEDRSFNRLRASDRKWCYEKWLPQLVETADNSL